MLPHLRPADSVGHDGHVRGRTEGACGLGWLLSGLALAQEGAVRGLQQWMGACMSCAEKSARAEKLTTRANSTTPGADTNMGPLQEAYL